MKQLRLLLREGRGQSFIMIGVAFFCCAIAVILSSSDSISVLTARFFLVVVGFIVIIRHHVTLLSKLGIMTRNALIDPLSHCFNRTGGFEMLRREITARTLMLHRRNYIKSSSVTRRKKRIPICIMALDLDHFKEINDCNGHDAGDTAIRELGLILRQIFRETDVCIRMGGDEFCVVMLGPAVTLKTVLAKASQLHEAVKKNPAFLIDAKKTDDTVADSEYRRASLSIGALVGQAAIMFHDENNKGTTDNQIANMMTIADVAMYYAKQQGRDGTVIAAPSSSSSHHQGGREVACKFFHWPQNSQEVTAGTILKDNDGNFVI
jgi:diguanylate cyclase (GGDEF)-like protein